MRGADLLAQGYLWAFLSVFIGGFLTSLTPCVYPLISITVSVFGARDEHVTRARALLLASSYVAGIALMYTGLGIFSALAGRAFGVFMANRYLMVPLAAICFVMAASMFGAFELRLPANLHTRLASVGGKGFSGAFAMGLAGGVIAAPCTGPVLASVLAYVATTRSVLLGGGLLFCYALGMGVLFFALAAFALSLPRSGRWMETVKSIFGVAMAVAGLYFLRSVAPPLARYGSSALSWLMSHLALVAVGIALGGVHLSFHERLGHRLRKAFGVVAIIVGVFGSIGWLLTPRPQRWIQGESAGLSEAKRGHQPALIDFSADWCLPCKEMELKTFSEERVARELERFTLVKVDCTEDEDPTVLASKNRYHADTLPTLVLLDTAGKVARKIDHFVDADELLPLLQGVH